MIINVNMKDLEGVYTNPFDCPIARALKRLFPSKKVIVGPRTLEINYVQYDLPADANEKAQGMSNGYMTKEEFSFELGEPVSQLTFDPIF
jgi:hypothetical protein